MRTLGGGVGRAVLEVRDADILLWCGGGWRRVPGIYYGGWGTTFF